MRRADQGRLNDLVEVVCVVVVVAAVIALIAWIVLHDGGGALFQGETTRSAA